jgi:hypothetical protein
VRSRRYLPYLALTVKRIYARNPRTMSPSKIPIFPVRLGSALKSVVLTGAKKSHLTATDWIRQAIIEKAVRQGIEVPEKPEDEPMRGGYLPEAKRKK